MGWLLLLLFLWIAIEDWRAATTSGLLKEYGDYLEVLNGEVLDEAYDKEIVEEIELIERLYEEGKDYDDILRRRLETQRALGRRR